MLGTILTLITKWKWVVGAGAAAIVFAGGLYLGYNWADNACEAEKIKALQAQIELQEKIDKENKEINDALIEELEAQKGKTRVVYEKVIEYVEANPDTTNCELDATGLQLWNGETSD